MQNENIQSLGGKARAKKLTPEERQDIARSAAIARWGKDETLERPVFPKATHEGQLKLGGEIIDCAVLEDGTRLLTRAGFVRAIGRKGKVKGGDAYSPESKLPVFLSADNLKPFITDDLTSNSYPVYFKQKKGGIAMGYRAALLPSVCEVFLKARDAGDVLRDNQKHIAHQCDLLVRGLARVGITALVDEATEYQEVRDRQALQEVLKHYIDGKLYEWALTFPMEFFKGIFRLKGWKWNDGKMPGVVGKYVNDLVYSRLAAGVITELQKVNPPTEKGYRKHRHHQFFTRDIGHPELRQLVTKLIGMQDAFDDGQWEEFKQRVQTKYPKLNSTLMLPMNK